MNILASKEDNSFTLPDVDEAVAVRTSNAATLRAGMAGHDEAVGGPIGEKAASLTEVVDEQLRQSREFAERAAAWSETRAVESAAMERALARLTEADAADERLKGEILAWAGRASA